MSVCRPTLHVSTCCLFAFPNLAFVTLTFVCVGLCVMASCVFSGTEDSYTVTCGMPLPCLADTQKNNSGSHCLGKYTDLHLSFHSATQNGQLGNHLAIPRFQLIYVKIKQLLFLSLSLAGPEMASVPRIKSTATFKSAIAKCNLKRSQERLKESLNLSHSGTEVSTQEAEQYWPRTAHSG